MTASIQNSIRLRVFLILTLSIFVRLLRTASSSSVHKASGLLEPNYFLYGIVLICSLLPFKSAWFVGLCSQFTAVFLDFVALFLGSVATWRCKDQTGCIQTIPASILCLGFIFLITLLDTYQSWNVYLIVNGPIFTTSATQRIRILFSWSLPFAFLINLQLLLNSTWSPLVTPHLVADVLIIVMINSKENVFVGGVILVLLMTDALALLTMTDTLVTKAIVIQIAFSIAALLMFLGASPTQTKEEEKFESSEAKLPISIASEQTIRQRKSNKIKF